MALEREAEQLTVAAAVIEDFPFARRFAEPLIDPETVNAAAEYFRLSPVA
ncbi:hypothetical protein [Anatilimnocola floriformis]|nr:hypothetical protein [Anatilimnocola floriformis]